jgi:hypothetical protein
LHERFERKTTPGGTQSLCSAPHGVAALHRRSATPADQPACACRWAQREGSGQRSKRPRQGGQHCSSRSLLAARGMASASETAGLVESVDIDAIERDLQSPKVVPLPGSTVKAEAPENRYRAPAAADEDPDLVPKHSATPSSQPPQVDSAASGNTVAVPTGKRGRSFFRELNEDFAEDHRRLIFGEENAEVKLLEKDIEEVYPFIVNPERWARELWNFFQAFLLIYVAIMVPYRIGFDIDVELFTPEWWWELFVNLYFAADLFLNFYTGYYDADDMLEMRKKAIAQNYLKFWFWIDCVSCFPIDYVQLLFSDANGSASNLKLLKILRLVRLTKLLRLAKLRDILYQHEEQLESLERAGKLIGAALLILYSCHIFGCMWFFVGTMGSTGLVGPEEEVDVPGWIHSRGIDTTTKVSTQYLTSFYWAITVLTTGAHHVPNFPPWCL